VVVAGTVAVTCVSLTKVKPVASVLLNFTAVTPVKPVPLIVTVAPLNPAVGLKLLTTGTDPTVKTVPLVPVPVAVVTVMFPVIAVAGTVAVMEVSLHGPTVA
jgi:hypothetical protein